MTGSRGHTPAADVAERVAVLGEPRSRVRYWRSLSLQSGNVHEGFGPGARRYTEQEVRDRVAHDRALGFRFKIQYQDVLWFDGFTVETDWLTEPEEA